jgi:GTPase SAR1 family protein
VLPNYYPIVDGILIVYDSTNKDSFQNVRKYLNEIKTMSNIHVNKLLVGNKCDLISNKVINFENAKVIPKQNIMQQQKI